MIHTTPPDPDGVRVVSLAAAREARAEPGHEGLVCVCGSAWFTVSAVVLSMSGRPTGYAGVPRCLECSTVAPSGRG